MKRAERYSVHLTAVASCTPPVQVQRLSTALGFSVAISRTRRRLRSSYIDLMGHIGLVNGTPT